MILFQLQYTIHTYFNNNNNKKGERNFELNGICRFCYQTPDWNHLCTPMTTCKRDSPIRMHKVNCTVDPYLICLGSRTFYKKVECNWTSGYKHKVALTLSICLGGFGIDRFYLGQYKVFFINLKIIILLYYYNL